MNKIILDCDAGVDDALAIIMAINSKRINFYGITTVYGNSSLVKTTNNVCRILDYFNLDISVSKGESKPLKSNKINVKSIHGKDGLGDSKFLPRYSKRKIDEKNAVDFILHGIKEGVKILVATGPLTNVALAFKKNAELMNQLDKIIIMGGAVHTVGNIDTLSEFNFYADPDAVNYVLQKAKTKVILLPLNVTHKVIFTLKDKESLSDTHSGKLVKSIVQKYQNIYIDFGYKGNPLHDPLALSYVLDPSFLKLKPFFMKVESEGKYTRGVCLVEERPWIKIKPNVNVAIDVDSKRFLEYFKKVIA